MSQSFKKSGPLYGICLLQSLDFTKIAIKCQTKCTLYLCFEDAMHLYLPNILEFDESHLNTGFFNKGQMAFMLGDERLPEYANKPILEEGKLSFLAEAHYQPGIKHLL